MPQRSLPPPLGIPGLKDHYLEQFPWLARLPQEVKLLQPWAPYGVSEYRLDGLYPQVKLATGDLMWRQLPEGHERWQLVDGAEVGRAGHRAAQANYLFSVNDGSLSLRKRYFTFLRDVFKEWSFEKIQYFVWATVSCWYTKPTDMPEEFLERLVHLTIYRPPKDGGFAELYRSTCFSDVHLTTESLRGVHPEKVAIKLFLQRLADQLNQGLLEVGLQKLIQETMIRGGTVVLGDIDLIIERVPENDQAKLIIEASATSVEFVTGSQLKNLRWVGINGYLEDVEKVVKLICKFWKTTKEFTPKN